MNLFVTTLRIAIALGVLAFLLDQPRPVLAATAMETSVESLARDSQVVVRARALRRECRWSGDHRRLVSDVEIVVVEAWRGAPPGRLLVTFPGGELDGVAQIVDGAPSFEVGDEVVLFLGRRGGEWRVAGLALGAFKVEGAVATPDTTRFRMVARGVLPGEAPVRTMSLLELRRRVESVR